MASALLSNPTYALQPSAEQVALQTNYITNFNFLNQYLPDTYEKEFERYGNRTIASFLRMVGAEMPSNSDQIKWAEQGRLHIKYTNITSAAAAGAATATFTVADSGVTYIAIRVGQTVMIQNNTSGVFNKAIVTAVPSATTFTVAYYETAGQAFAVSTQCTVFIYGSEFKKGTNGMVGSLESEDSIYSNNPIIIKDKYAVNGSDMAQIGWVEVTTENGATGYLWYLKSEHETRLRFEDYLETSMIEAVPAASSSGAATAGYIGSEGIFYVVNNRGNVWGGGTPTTLSDLFDNDVDMALNLGFTGFRRGYDFYKSDWKYLNDPTMRGGLNTTAATATGTITGLMVPAGSTSVYDQIMGKNAKRPFLHVRYRASEAEDRRYKTWITGSAGGAATSDLDAMEVNFLSERCVCTLGANNFVLFRYG
jgi:hypothetical protein